VVYAVAAPAWRQRRFCEPLIDEIRLTPHNGTLQIHWVGQLTQLRALGQKHLQPGLKETRLQITLVAGAGIVLYRTKTR